MMKSYDRVPGDQSIVVRRSVSPSELETNLSGIPAPLAPNEDRGKDCGALQTGLFHGFTYGALRFERAEQRSQ
jgi:hypothetical protein